LHIDNIPGKPDVTDGDRRWVGAHKACGEREKYLQFLFGGAALIVKFYRVCWPIIKTDIMAAISAVWSRKMSNFEVLNSAYITLLPKKDDATNIREYRPISLVHSLAKLITKLLANSLAGRLDQMITPNQSAFIKGRFILDNFMLVQHTTRFLYQQKQPRILLKLDITKAFDSVVLALSHRGNAKFGFWTCLV
jgi:hypothetical protein